MDNLKPKCDCNFNCVSFAFFYLCLNICLHIMICYHVFLSNIDNLHKIECIYQLLRTNRMLLTVSFEAEFNWFESRVFLLLDWLPYLG